VAIFAGADAIALFFFFPETQYFRESEDSTQVAAPTEKGPTTSEEPESVSSHSDIPKKSYLQQLTPWSGINPGIAKNTSFFNLLVRSWPMVVYPAVIYSFLTFAFNLACILAILNTAASIFQTPPYNMSPGIQSLIFIPGLVGAAAGAIWGGAMTDRYIRWQTRKNNGVFEPEFRLPPLILPFFIVPAGVLMYLILKLC
jgi:hypothetical protein